MVISPSDRGVPSELAFRYTSLDVAAKRHLERLMASWSLLADFSFSDLLLFVPAASELGPIEQWSLAGGRAPEGPSGDEPAGPRTGGPARPGVEEPDRTSEETWPFAFLVLGQVRPTTSQTLYEVDLVGQVQRASLLPGALDAFARGEIVRGEQQSAITEGIVRTTSIPIRCGAEVVGVLCRIWSPRTTRRRGTLERVYLELFERLSVMVTDGLFPFEDDDDAVEEAPRVGDGVIVVDARGRVTYASPNAVNALHRAAITTSIVGSTLPDLGLETSAVDEAFSSLLPVIEEVERRPDVILLVRCIPLVARGALTGAAILVRDVSDLRRRDRLLLTKDATIREVHHRVKNNLQTISSLLRLQARRLDESEAQGRTALLEAERRIRAIAVVHEILAREATEQVPFDEIVQALVELIRDTNVVPVPVEIVVDGGLGEVAAEIATPLAVAVAELLQNALEHAFGDPSATGPGAAEVHLVLRHHDGRIDVEVRDNGCGLPEGFDIDRTRSLGLSIVRDLVRSQLGGTIGTRNEAGAVVAVAVPTRARESAPRPAPRRPPELNAL